MNILKLLGLEPDTPLIFHRNNVWPDIQREYPDPKRPGLVFTVPPEHVLLCPFEIERLQQEWDAKNL